MTALTSTFTPATRADLARDTRPSFTVATYTLKERVENAHIENAMIDYASKQGRRQIAHHDNKPSKYPSKTAIPALRDWIKTAPETFTAQDAAAALGRQPGTMAEHLRKLAAMGELTTEDHRDETGRLLPRLYRKPISPNVAANIAKGRNTDERVMVMMDKPMAPFQVMEEANLSRAAISATFRRLAKAGRIKKAHHVKNSRGLPVLAWVRA